MNLIVLVPLIWVLTPCAKQPNSLAAACSQVALVLGSAIS
jgi:hypothetical protein